MNQAKLQSDLQSDFMEISPAMAAQILATSPGNRALRPSYVTQLAGAMLRGEWKTTHQGIALDYRGRLRDGHHRLNAIVKSGVTITLMVTTGLDPEATDTMDHGRARTVADSMLVDKRIAEPLRLAAFFYYRSKNPTVAQVRHAGSGGLMKVLGRLIDECPSTRRHFSAAPVKLAAAIIIMRDGAAVEPHVFGQYRALISLDFDAMTEEAKFFVRRVQGGRVASVNTHAMLACGMRVFDRSTRRLGSRIVLTSELAEAAAAEVRAVIAASLGENPDTRTRDEVIGERVSAAKRMFRPSRAATV